MQLINIDPYKVRMPTTDVRKYRNAKWFENFMAQINIKGVKDPIRIYKPDDFNTHGEYELIDGHTRLLAARILKLKEIPALLVDKPKDSAYMESGYLNTWQQDLDPISHAYYAEQVVRKHIFDFNRAAEELGISEGHLRRLLKLLSLPDDLKRKIAQGESPAFTHEGEIVSAYQTSKQRRKKGASGQRCLICGRWPEEGNRKWILLCAEHEDEINAIMDYIMSKGWRHT